MKLSIQDFAEHKKSGLRISVLTCYDYTFARQLNQTGINALLVGDSLANVVLGMQATREVSMDQMVWFLKAVVKGAPDKHVIADMPYDADRDKETALNNAMRFMEAGASSVKLEGAKTEIIHHLTDNGVPVMGHLGLTPQTASSYKQVGKDPAEALQLKLNALAVEKAGVFSLVLEHIPDDLGAEISASLKIPTIGIGAGLSCDGQVLVLYDMLKLTPGKLPPFAKTFAEAGDMIRESVNRYIEWIG